MSSKPTKEEIQVLYQIDSNIYDLQRIADILPNQDLKSVKEHMASARKKGLLKSDEGKPALTEKGKEALEKHKVWIFG